MTKQSNISSTHTNIKRFDSLINRIKRDFSSNINAPKQQFFDHQQTIIVSIVSQALYLMNNKELILEFSISSAEAGIGNKTGSLQTPLGIHQISEKIGENAPISSIFKGRKNTHEIAEILKTKDSKSEEDNITSRILRLDGLEEGFNKGIDQQGNIVDSHSRYIYIHGTDEEGRLGQIASHGCIRMANLDIIQLFNKSFVGDIVAIVNN